MSIFDIAEPTKLKEFREAEPLSTWNHLKSNSDANNAVKKHTRKKTGGLCVYCEHKLIPKHDFQIEHYYPKKGNDNSYFGKDIPNRAIQWENLFPGCLGGTAQAQSFTEKKDIDYRTGANKRNKDKLTCGQRKGETDPDGVCISPYKLNNRSPIFLYNEADGSISLNEKVCDVQSIDRNLARAHVTRLNLDSPRLRGARATLASSLRNEFNKALDFDSDTVDELINEWLELNGNGLYDHPFISLISSKYIKI